MAKTRIAGALVVGFLTSCSLVETERQPRALHSPLADRVESGRETVDGKGIDSDPRAQAAATVNAGLRNDFNALC